jgi:hypothetical protein
MDVSEVSAPPDANAAAESSLANLTRDAVRYARTWSKLAASEAALAKINLARMLLGAVLFCALVPSAFIVFDALLVAMAFDLLHDWVLAIGAVALLDLGLLLTLLWLLRSWWRTLSLPRSRAALTDLWRADLWRRDNDAGTNGPGAAAHSSG